MICGEGAGVWNEAMWFGAATISAEARNLQHANPPHPRSNVFVLVTPCLKRGGIQVRILVLVEESVQRLQRARGKIETAAQSPLQIDIPGEDGRQARQKHRGEDRLASCQHRPSLPLCRPGTARATSRKSPVANRRYTDVLSAVRWPRMS